MTDATLLGHRGIQLAARTILAPYNAVSVLRWCYCLNQKFKVSAKFPPENQICQLRHWLQTLDSY